MRRRAVQSSRAVSRRGTGVRRTYRCRPTKNTPMATHWDTTTVAKAAEKDAWTRSRGHTACPTNAPTFLEVKGGETGWGRGQGGGVHGGGVDQGKTSRKG
jgi:hypothetical protein